MPEHFRALIVILAAAIPVFALSREPTGLLGVSDHDFRRYRNLWLAITLTAFLAHNFWVYCFACALIVMTCRSPTTHVAALYLLLLCAVPPFRMMIPGFGPIENIIEIDHVRVLNASLLFPAFLRLRLQRRESSGLPKWIDSLVLAYLMWVLTKILLNDSLTGFARSAVGLLIDVGLPYYVLSRSLRSLGEIRLAAAMLVISGLTIALLSFFEFWRFWLLYESLRPALGVPSGLPMYLTRGDAGLLRSNVSLGNSIVVGFVLMVALAMLLMLLTTLKSGWKKAIAFLALIAGFVGSLSRGPWVGASVVLLTFTALAPTLGRKVMNVMLLVGSATAALAFTPLGRAVIPYLPFVGTVETGSIDYREQLFEVSISVLLENRWSGDYWYLNNPVMQQMRQGQGIIDMVNTYLQVALPFGIIGLVLFTAPFILALLGLYKNKRRFGPTSAEYERVSRALFAAILGTLVTIATVSNIGVIATLQWGLLAMTVAFFSVTSTDVSPKSATPQERPLIVNTLQHR